MDNKIELNELQQDDKVVQLFFDKCVAQPTDESHDDNDDVDIDCYDEEGNPIRWYELHDDVLPRVASVIKKYKEIYTDELIEHLFTKTDITRLNKYMATHDVDEKHLKIVFKCCHDWIRTQMSYDRGRPTYDLFIQDICHCQPKLYEELSKLCSDDEYYIIYEAIDKLNNADDIHDFAGNIAERINFVGSLFGFGEDPKESIWNEKILMSCLEARCEFIRANGL